METKTPARRALAVLDTPPVPSDPTAQRRISKKVRSGIEYMVSGDCKIIKEAAEAGLSREHFTCELSKPHVAAYMREKVLKQLAIAAARAGGSSSMAWKAFCWSLGAIARAVTRACRRR